MLIFRCLDLRVINAAGKKYLTGKTRAIAFPAFEMAITNGSGFALRDILVYGKRFTSFFKFAVF